MFNSANRINTLEYIDIRKTLPSLNQEDLFAKYTGVWPDLKKRYKSLLRPDRTPGCRFKYHDGILYFIDNVGINGKISFNIVDVISYLKGISIKESINLIIRNENIDLSFITDYTKTDKKSKLDIRFKYKEWPKDNYFKIDPYHLYNENVYLVDDYWIKQDSDYEWNYLYNPKKTLTIAYYFPDTNHVKLYFPNEHSIKWYTNCDQNDIFGESKLDYYLEKDDRLIIITKSQKDRLILDYVYGYNAIAMQNEKINFDKVINKIKQFKKQIILFDNDLTGQTQAGIFSNQYDIPWVNIEVAKDSYEAHIKYNNLCKSLN